MTLTERILARAAGRSSVRPGEEVWASVDLAVMHDSSGPRRIGPLLDRLGGRLWDPEKVVLAIDHFWPPGTLTQAEIVTLTRAWARDHELPHFFDGQGVLHNLLLEAGLARAGMLVVGADSHTCTAGAIGAVAVGVGATELATVLATGEIWLRVPSTVLIRFEGSLPSYLAARDLAMTVLGSLGADFAIYRAVEYGGDAVATLPLDERAVLTNQAVEMGAKNGIIAPPPDAPRIQDGTLDLAPTAPEACEAVHTFRVRDLEPLVALPPRVDHVRPVRELEGLRVDRAYIGSCAGGKTTDLRLAARVLRGRRVRVPLVVTPATQAVVRECLADGTLGTLAEAGVVLQAPGCGACAGLHSGLLGPGERCVATVTRNNPGRMGHRSAEIYLASPLTVAASALTGRLTDPREVL